MDPSRRRKRSGAGNAGPVGPMSAAKKSVPPADAGDVQKAAPYQVLARRTRPQTFADVIGQEHVTQTLSNAIRAGRLAHAFVFSGMRGVGKTTTARILAK